MDLLLYVDELECMFGGDIEDALDECQVCECPAHFMLLGLTTLRARRYWIESIGSKAKARAFTSWIPTTRPKLTTACWVYPDI